MKSIWCNDYKESNLKCLDSDMSAPILIIGGGIAGLMCAEVLWWRCHRRIITDYLITHGHDVYHIFDLNNVKSASININAIINKKRVITYPS